MRKEEFMRPFTLEAAEQVISLLCYSRTDDRYNSGQSGKPTTGAGAFRLAEAIKEDSPKLVLSDIYDPGRYRTITVADAVQQGLLDPSWEDFATKLYLNDQDILYMCLMSSEDPVRLRLKDVERVKAYRDQHNDKATAVKFTYMPRLRRANVPMRSVPRNAGVGPGKQDMSAVHLHQRAKTSSGAR
jgi:hypothetical protein